MQKSNRASLPDVSPHAVPAVTAAPHFPVERIVRIREACEITGCSRSGVYVQIADGVFPRSVSLIGTSVGWPLSELQTLVRARIAGRSAEQIRVLITQLHDQRKHALD